MTTFEKGDILVGKIRDFDEAYHPIVFMGGSDEAPLAVVLTHSGNFVCNIALSGKYDEKPSYFVAHLIEKMAEWGPYQKTGKLTKEDLSFVEGHVSDSASITWFQYLEFKKGGCLGHEIALNAQE